MSWNATNDNEPPFLHDHPVLGPFVRMSYAYFVKPAVWFRKNVEAVRGDPPAYYHKYVKYFFSIPCLVCSIAPATINKD